MNNIEILEKAIKVLTGNDTGIKLDFENTAQAIENLIQENKKIYKNYLKLKSEIEILNNAYIPKSKVKEKIEELEKEYKILQQTSDFIIIADTIQPKIKVLQELLEEGE